MLLFEPPAAGIDKNPVAEVVYRIDAVNYFSNWILINASSGWLEEQHEFWFKDRSGWKDMVKLEQ